MTHLHQFTPFSLTYYKIGAPLIKPCVAWILILWHFTLHQSIWNPHDIPNPITKVNKMPMKYVGFAEVPKQTFPVDSPSSGFPITAHQKNASPRAAWARRGGQWLPSATWAALLPPRNWYRSPGETRGFRMKTDGRNISNQYENDMSDIIGPVESGIGWVWYGLGWVMVFWLRWSPGEFPLIHFKSIR